jgi:uncharacterized protein (TIRG00374 family)
MSFLIFVLKALVSLGLLSYLFSKVDFTQLLRVLSTAHVSYFILALTAYFVAKIITSVRWALLARPLGFKNHSIDFAILYFIGMFFNLFSPSTLGGDLGRTFYLSRAGAEDRKRNWTRPPVYAFTSVLVDRLIGMAVLVWIGAVALIAFPSYSSFIPLVIRYLTFGLALGFLLGWMLLPLISRLLRWTEHILGKNLHIALEVYWHNQQILLRAILLSLIVHLIQTWIQVLLGKAIDLDLPWSYCFIFFPLVDILSLLPMSLSGVGVREGGYLFLLGRLNISPEKAIACGFLWFAVVLLNGLIGGIVFVLSRNPRPSTSQEHNV